MFISSGVEHLTSTLRNQTPGPGTVEAHVDDLWRGPHKLDALLPAPPAQLCILRKEPVAWVNSVYVVLLRDFDECLDVQVAAHW